MNKSKALTYSTFGKPLEVIQLEERAVPDPSQGEAKLRLLASPVHPSDIGIILGKYGKLPDLPTIAGREGVAEVLEVGTGVESPAVGDRVVVPGSAGCWQTLLTLPAEDLMVVPKEIPVEMAAMVMVNPPTAWRLIRDAHLEDGDWIVQNAANSAVGLHVIEIARHLGIKTLNVVRREELIEPLLKHGADQVVLEDSGYEKKVAELTGGAPVRLALNSVGGESALRLVNALSENGTHITFGAMTFDAVRFPTRQLIFNGLVMKGFWMDQWFRGQGKARIQVMFDKIFDLMARGIIQPSVDSSYPIEEYKQAFEAAAKPRLGKVLFRFD